MELILTDGKVLEELAREDKTLWEKTKKEPKNGSLPVGYKSR